MEEHALLVLLIIILILVVHTVNQPYDTPTFHCMEVYLGKQERSCVNLNRMDRFYMKDHFIVFKMSNTEHTLYFKDEQRAEVEYNALLKKLRY